MRRANKPTRFDQKDAYRTQIVDAETVLMVAPGNKRRTKCLRVCFKRKRKGGSTHRWMRTFYKPSHVPAWIRKEIA